MNTFWAIPICILAIGVLCGAIACYKAGKRIANLERDVKELKEKNN